MHVLGAIRQELPVPPRFGARSLGEWGIASCGGPLSGTCDVADRVGGTADAARRVIRS
jgi:hypothetical protein